MKYLLTLVIVMLLASGGYAFEATNSPSSATTPDLWNDVAFMQFPDLDTGATRYSATCMDADNHAWATQFAFSIADSCQVDSFYVQFAAATDGSNDSLRFQFTKNGTTVVGTQYTYALTVTMTDYIKGQGNGLWGTTYFNSDVGASTFGLRVSTDGVVSATISVDYVQIRVFYSLLEQSQSHFSGQTYRANAYRDNGTAWTFEPNSTGDFDAVDSVSPFTTNRTYHSLPGTGNYAVMDYQAVLGAAQETIVVDSIFVILEGHGISGVTVRRDIGICLSTDSGGTCSGDEVIHNLLYDEGGKDRRDTISGTTNRLWGSTVTDAQIESYNFAVRVRKTTNNSSAVRIDAVHLRVFYHAVSYTGQIIVVGGD